MANHVRTILLFETTRETLAEDHPAGAGGLKDAARPRRLTIREAMSSNPRAPYCSICGRMEPSCGLDALAVVCSLCTAKRAAVPMAAHKAARLCPDCGGPLPARKKFCQGCQRQRRRRTYQAARNSLWKNAVISPCGARAENDEMARSDLEANPGENCCARRSGEARA